MRHLPWTDADLRAFREQPLRAMRRPARRRAGPQASEWDYPPIDDDSIAEAPTTG